MHPSAGRSGGRGVLRSRNGLRGLRGPLTLLCLLVLAPTLAGCGASPSRTARESIAPTLDPSRGPAASLRGGSLQVDGPPVATVDGTAITRQEWADRVKLIRYRYDRERTRLQAQVAAGEVNEQTAQERLMGLASNAADAESVAIEELIDLALQGRLAREQQLAITPADVDAALAAEARGDPAFLSELARSLDETAYRRNLEAEVLAAKLRTEIVDRATAGTVDQLRVSEILLQGVEENEGGTDRGAIRASHIVYSPKDDWENAPGLPLDDPAWVEAQTQAEAAADTLKAITDPVARSQRFAELARTESDEAMTGAEGGDLGWVSPDQLAPEMADALFAVPYEVGDIIGPVPTEFGASVLLYVDRRSPLAERVASVQARLAEP
ncbi:MAG: peptidylprolyl isomerase, partial [Chloroflexi bacterium]|nr:peptidylprolyl isomerase [Chloroflexota bacterium]